MKNHVAIILKEMCRRVNADPKDVDFKKDNWYWDYSWTEDEEEKFILWLEKYLKKDRDARLKIMAYPNLQKCYEAAQSFAFQYGWKTKTKI